MNYIINPRIFYWMNVLEGLKALAIAFLVLGSVMFLIYGIFALVDMAYLENEERKALKTVFRIFTPIFVFGLLGSIFIPDKQTLIEMLIAKTATVENAEWTVDAVKQAVDYIVNSIQTLK